MFDDLANLHGVQKVETAGDCKLDRVASFFCKAHFLPSMSTLT